MSLALIIVLLFVAIAAGVVAFGVLSRISATEIRGQTAVSANLRALVAAQRAQQSNLGKAKSSTDKSRRNLAVAAASEADAKMLKREASQRIALERKLKYASWPITPIQYRLIQFIATLLLIVPATQMFGYMIQGMILFLSPLIVNSVLEMYINKRFNHFDEDYPVLLLQYVSLLKTGLSTLTGLEAASKGLDDTSLVRKEVELLIERLRLGLTEEQAINAFGEDIPHPEIELFVQSLLLSRRVGGTLSLTLERLAKQVRKRQEFRKKAVAAVGMERGSMIAIAGIMTCLMIFLTIKSPELVLPALTHPIGRQVFEGGISLVIVGFYWSRQVTKIKA